MKRKIFSILFALVLVLSLSLVPAVAWANGSSITGAVTLVAQGDSTVEWTSEEVKFGGYSAKLTMPAGTGWVNDNAEARIAISGAPTLNDVTSWSFWAKGQNAYYVPIEFYIDTDGDEVCDKIILGQKMGSMTSEWVQLNQANMSMYMAWKDGYEWLWNWSKVQQKYGDATLLRVDIGYGSLGSNKAIIAYVDDFTLNDTTYVFEPPPPIEVEIDIKPGSYPNSINPKSKGLIPVAVLTTPDFDATTVDGTTVMFAGASPAHDLSDPTVVADHQHDVDLDGDIDYVFHFRVQDTNIMPGDTFATLTGLTTGGVPITGTDSVRIVGK